MLFFVRPAIDRGRLYAFPAVWAAVFVTGVGWRLPLPVDASSFLSFNVADAQAAMDAPPAIGVIR